MVFNMLCNIKGGSYTIARVNEDAYGHDRDCAWVLDGSTGLNGKRLVADETGSDAQWYALAFSEYLKTALPGSEAPLQEIFSEGVRRVWAEFEKKAGGKVARGDVPCCVGTAVRIRDGFLEYINVGDCCLLIRFRDGSVTELLNSTLVAMDNNTLRMAVEISQKEGIPISQCRQKILPQLQRVRLTMNTPEGYISLADNAAAVLQAKTGRFPLAEIRDVCMVSDGFSEYYNMFGLAKSLEDFMNAVAAEQPQELFDRLLAAQQADGDFAKHPRFKLSDDATLLYFPL